MDTVKMSALNLRLTDFRASSYAELVIVYDLA